MDQQTEFLSTVFECVRDQVEGVVSDFELHYGPDFERKDVVWQEDKDVNGWPYVYSLRWKDDELLEVYMDPRQMKAHCIVTKRCTRH